MEPSSREVELVRGWSWEGGGARQSGPCALGVWPCALGGGAKPYGQGSAGWRPGQVDEGVWLCTVEAWPGSVGGARAEHTGAAGTAVGGCGQETQGWGRMWGAWSRTMWVWPAPMTRVGRDNGDNGMGVGPVSAGEWPSGKGGARGLEACPGAEGACPTTVGVAIPYDHNAHRQQ